MNVNVMGGLVSGCGGDAWEPERRGGRMHRAGQFFRVEAAFNGWSRR
jgi:hypothetical protein